MKEDKKKEENKKLDIIKLVILTILLVALIVVSIVLIVKRQTNDDEQDDKVLAYTELVKEIQNKNVEKIEMTVGSTTLKVKLKDEEEEKKAIIPNTQVFMELIQSQTLEGNEIKLEQKTRSVISQIPSYFFSILPTAIMVALFIMIYKMQGLGDKGQVYEETERIMYWTVVNELKENGYNQYEISNFSKKTYESKHNTNCWKQNHYIGLGTSAHSYLNKKRYSNTNNIEEYIKNIQENNISKNITIHEEQTEESTMNEYMLLGLRMIQGININEFKQKFKIDPTIKYKETLEKLQKENLIQITKTSIKLTKQGIDFGNIVWEEFI